VVRLTEDVTRSARPVPAFAGFGAGFLVRGLTASVNGIAISLAVNTLTPVRTWKSC